MSKTRKISFARLLRRSETDDERKLWNVLRSRQTLGLKFRRQYPVGPYVLDFYCHEANLAIELDGGQHFSEQGIKHDGERSADLAKLGIRVVRFSNLDVLDNIEGVSRKIAEIVQPLTPSLSPWERGLKTEEDDETN